MRSESIERLEGSATDRGSADGCKVAASIVVTSDEREAAYRIYEARDLSSRGAFLAGSLFLELNEEFTLELDLGEHRLRARARVASVERGATPGMAVVFANLSDSDRALLERETGQATKD